MGIGLHRLGVEKVEPADIEGGGDRDLGAAGDQPFGEMHATVAMVQSAIDMSGGDVHHPAGTQQTAHLGSDPHGHGGGFAPLAGTQGPLLIAQLHAHPGNLPQRSPRARSDQVEST